MSRRLKQASAVFVGVFAAVQLIRPDFTAPPTDVARTIQAQHGTTSGFVAVLDRACSDCHSNNTAWPWYTRIAPLSWAVAYGVSAGRKAVNFSEWASYSPEQQRLLLVVSCDDVTRGKMPGPYALLHPEMRLSAQDIEAICTAARQGEAKAADRR